MMTVCPHCGTVSEQTLNHRCQNCGQDIDSPALPSDVGFEMAKPSHWLAYVITALQNMRGGA